MRIASLYATPAGRKDTVCPGCGKRFAAGAAWAYWHRADKYCSWSCMRRAEREDEKEDQMEQAKEELMKRAQEMKAESLTNKVIAAELGVSDVTVGKWLKLAREEAPEEQTDGQAEAPAQEKPAEPATEKPRAAGRPERRDADMKQEAIRLLDRMLDVVENILLK